MAEALGWRSVVQHVPDPTLVDPLMNGGAWRLDRL